MNDLEYIRELLSKNAVEIRRLRRAVDDFLEVYEGTRDYPDWVFGNLHILEPALEDAQRAMQASFSNTEM